MRETWIVFCLAGLLHLVREEYKTHRIKPDATV